MTPEKIWQWYVLPPCGPPQKEALAAVASVAVVLWTGALIAYQIGTKSPVLDRFLEFVRFSIFMPLLAMVVNGVAVRTLSFAVLLMTAPPAVRAVINMVQTYRSVNRQLQESIGVRLPKATLYITLLTGLNQAFRIVTTLAALAIFTMPTQGIVTISSIAILVVSLWLITSHFQAVQKATSKEDKSST